MTPSILVSVSRDCSVVAETSLLGDGGTLDRGSTGIILGPEGGMVPLLLRTLALPSAEGIKDVAANSRFADPLRCR